jgi:hypothetical protein
VMTRGAFHRQGPFVESGGLSSPVPRPLRRLSAKRKDRRAALSRHPGPSPILHRLTPAQSETPPSFRTTRSLTFHRQRSPRLGPRSLSPPLFWERCVRAYSRPGCCLSTSATAMTTYGQPTGALVSSQGRWPRPPSFSERITRDLSRESGDTWRAAQRPFDQTSVPVPPTFAGLPDRDT